MTAPAAPPLPEPKQPAAWATYERLRDFRPIPGDPLHLAWRRGRVLVLSSVDHMEFHGELRPQWLVSVSSGGGRATDAEVKRVLRDFDMDNAEEDNHLPGIARGFFLLCDAKPDDPQQCECKETEEVIVEPDGYTWSRERT